ncbi:hypothetical protein GVX82_03895, partial [Patescibacteria group bacterium]|nr:hypothetical protein [Patescibacteria group bacterium]
MGNVRVRTAAGTAALLGMIGMIGWCLSTGVALADPPDPTDASDPTNHELWLYPQETGAGVIVVAHAATTAVPFDEPLGAYVTWPADAPYLDAEGDLFYLEADGSRTPVGPSFLANDTVTFTRAGTYELDVYGGQELFLVQRSHGPLAWLRTHLRPVIAPLIAHTARAQALEYTYLTTLTFTLTK